MHRESTRRHRPRCCVRDDEDASPRRPRRTRGWRLGGSTTSGLIEAQASRSESVPMPPPSRVRAYVLQGAATVTRVVA